MNNNTNTTTTTTTTTTKLLQGYVIYKYHHLTDSWMDLGKYNPAPDEDCCSFALVKLWNSDTGFAPSTLIDNQCGKYWLVTLEDDAAMRKQHNPIKVIPTNIPTTPAINFAL